MNHTRLATQLLTGSLVGFVPRIATAEPTEPTPAAPETAPAAPDPVLEGSGTPSTEPQDPLSEPAFPSEPAPPAVPEPAWAATQEQNVILELRDGAEIRGKLVQHDATSAVLVQADGRVVVVEKATVTSLRVELAPEPVPQPQAEPQPSSPSASAPATAPPPAHPASEREFARLGFFVAQGAGFAHWTGADSEGTAAYAADFGLGFNTSKSVGLYAVGGGLFAGRMFEKDVKANYGHLAAAVVGRGRYFGAALGIGLGFSSLVTADDPSRAFRDLGLAIPIKMQGFIPLPKNLYIGVGLAYDFAAFQKFEMLFNGVSGFVSFGRW